MHHYHNLLYVSHGAADESEGMKQALSLARNNQATLKVMVVTPEFPKEFAQHRESYERALLSQTDALIASTRKALKLAEDEVKTSCELLPGKHASLAVIQKVLQHGYDLVIKEAQPRAGTRGFNAIDMDLLRKCPSPVWLCQPIAHSRNEMKVAVAIDPESQEPAAEQLSVRLLQVARAMANQCSGKLEIISCWDDLFESTLKHSGFIRVSEEEIEARSADLEHTHRAALDRLIAQADIAEAYTVHHVRGKPDTAIPAFIDEEQVDVLVMGTVARTGIAGFITGNTAENIMQQLSCSLMAMKPQGFVSPVKAY